jgi:two-component system chemotaxis sensor kinase CheA
MDEILAMFIQESREQIEAMEAGLLGLEQGQCDDETLNAIFRAAHTVKGSAGVVELGMIVRFTHVLENALDKLRNAEIRATSGLISALLEGCDHLGILLDRVTAGITEDDAALQTAGDAVAARLIEQINAQGGQLAAAPSAHPREKINEVENAGGSKAIDDCWHISVRFGENVLRQGMDPAAILRHLLTLGEIAHIDTLADTMPTAAEMNPESCYLGCEIRFRSHASKESIERVFDFVRDDCALRILPPDSKVADYLQLIRELPEEPMRLGEILVRCGALTGDELLAGLSCQLEEAAPPEASAPPRLGDILVEQKIIQPEVVEAAIVKQKQVNDKKAEEARLIRVQAGKLDQLIDLVGELVIAGASASLLAQKSQQGPLVEATSILTRLVENIRDSALQLRMVQIGETFSRFNRVVRDVSRELGKEVDLQISGGETELDKSVVEKIGDPLMHLVRNAIDHGIETIATRTARGKPAAGRLELKACHDSGSIVIEIIDDGGGLPHEKIRAKAIERGLISANQTLSDAEIANLIFEPGFSTAEKVTNLSGRGVGMDVVKRNIQALRGSVEVDSVEGQGSRFTIRLPLTLAIIDGFLVGVDKAAYVVPLEMVVECLELRNVPADQHYLNLRGEVLPFVCLRELFEIEGERPVRENVVVVRAGGRKLGVVVDVLQGEFQTVIKPLSTIFRHLRGIGGSTILGSGEVALILDIPVLAQIAAQTETMPGHLSSSPSLNPPLNTRA